MFTKKSVATTITTTTNIIITRPQPSWWTITARQLQQQQQQLQHQYHHCQQRQHRYRSNLSSNDEGRNTINKTKKHSRKRKLLNAPSLHAPVVTTKDRIRLLWETNQQLPTTNRFQGSGLAVAPAQDLLEVATSRLTYVRQSIYQYWNPDYHHNNNNNTSTASPSPPRQVRTYKTGLVVMDTRWWIWNILFSLLPAAIITIYCELRGKHLMYAFHHRLEVEQLQQILGEEDFTVERANAIIAARNKERDELEAWGGGDLDEQAYRYIKNVIKTAVATAQMIFIQLWNEYVATNNNGHDIRNDEENDAHHHHTDGNTNHSPDSTVRTVVETIPPGPDPPSTKGTTPTAETRLKSDTLTNDLPPAPKSSNENDNNGVVVNPSMEYILQRIEQIEERLRQQPHIEPQPPTPSVSTTTHDAEVDREEENKEAIRIIAQRLKRMNQSDIHNRFEIAEKEKWKKYILEVVGNDPVRTEQSNTDAPPQSSSPAPSDTTMSSNPIEFVWTRYGAPFWRTMLQSWTDRLNDDDDAKESAPDPPTTLEAPSNAAVDRHHVSTTTTTTTQDLETRIPPHGSDSRTDATITSAVPESTHHPNHTSTTSRQPWWKFFG
jgi:hypothetical protein